MPSIPVVMPRMGESLTEGTLVEWHTREGDHVDRDEVIAEIETDKVSTELEAPASGVVGPLLVEAGATVAVGVSLTHITVDGDDESAAADQATTVAAPGGGHFEPSGGPTTVAFGRRRQETGGDSSPADSRRDAVASGEQPTSTFVSPAVLRAAVELGIPAEELTRQVGSGRGGRLTRRDVEALGRQRQSTPAPAAHSTSQRLGEVDEAPERFRYRPTERDQRSAMSPTRRAIADHMVWSTKLAPQATAMDDVDVTDLRRWVTEHKDDFTATAGAPLSYTTVIAFATVRLLAEFPMLNAAVVDDDIVLRPYVHLGIAVDLPERHELVVPVLTDADQLPLHVFARRLDDVVTRARERRLEPREVSGGSFTLSNPGVIGGTNGTPIINQPQVAILATYAIRQRPWVIDDSIGIRRVMGASLSFDHRVVDGADAFRFLARLGEDLGAMDSWIGG